MKIVRLIIALLLLIAFLFYTQQSLSVAKFIGKETGNFVKDVYGGLKQKEQSGDFKEIEHDLGNLKEKVTS